jgi:hypothetical protein
MGIVGLEKRTEGQKSDLRCVSLHAIEKGLDLHLQMQKVP